MSDADVPERDNDLKWLMEHSHNAYLAWIALWLACMLGIGNILITIVSISDTSISLANTLLVFLLYWGLVGGMIFSVYRVSNIIKEQIIWANKIKREFLKSEILSHRGKFSKFVVDNDGTLCTRNRNLACVLHVVIAMLLLLPFLLA